MEKGNKQPKLGANSVKPTVGLDEEPLYRPYSKNLNSMDNNARRNLSNIRLQALICGSDFIFVYEVVRMPLDLEMKKKTIRLETNTVKRKANSLVSQGSVPIYITEQRIRGVD